MKFKNRENAANLLTRALHKYKNKDALVLGIPRGAIPMAKIIADGLNGELGAIFLHKIPAPDNEEFAIGAVGLSGHIQRMPYTDTLHIPESYIQEAAEKQIKILKLRQKQYGLKDPNYENRIVIIVDDGIATGATTLGAINEVKAHHPKKLIVAAPVASQDSIEKIQEEVDELVILYEPELFYAVGQFFDDFSQVTDEEVIDIFNESKKLP